MKRKNTYSYEDLLLSGEGKLFGKGNPTLPKPPMLMFDRITHIDQDGGDFNRGLITAEIDIKPDLWFFGCHFHNDPVMPGCLGLDGMWQLLGFFMGWTGANGVGRALGVGETKFSGQVLPDGKLAIYTINVKRIIKKDLVIGVADGSMSLDNEKIYTAKSLRVALFKSHMRDPK